MRKVKVRREREREPPDEFGSDLQRRRHSVRCRQVSSRPSSVACGRRQENALSAVLELGRNELRRRRIERSRQTAAPAVPEVDGGEGHSFSVSPAPLDGLAVCGLTRARARVAGKPLDLSS